MGWWGGWGCRTHLVGWVAAVELTERPRMFPVEQYPKDVQGWELPGFAGALGRRGPQDGDSWFREGRSKEGYVAGSTLPLLRGGPGLLQGMTWLFTSLLSPYCRQASKAHGGSDSW